jgi:hypothetical protein
MKIAKTFSAPEVMVTLKCDVHPWMNAYLGILPHPFFDVSDENGFFELKNLPAGNFILEAWHEKLGVQTLEVTAVPQETREIEFRFPSQMP